MYKVHNFICNVIIGSVQSFIDSKYEMNEKDGSTIGTHPKYDKGSNIGSKTSKQCML